MSHEVHGTWGDARGQAMYRLPTGSRGAGGDALGPMLEAFRRLQDLIVGTAVPQSALTELTARLNDLGALLVNYRVDERYRHDARRVDLPGRGSALLPPYTTHTIEPARLAGHVTFSRYSLGANGAVHGGVQPLLFDDVLGRVVNSAFSTIARTAFLTTNYRRITPLDQQLLWEATLDRIEGRKRWASARLHDREGRVTCDATGLFVELLPGQP